MMDEKDVINLEDPNKVPSKTNTILQTLGGLIGAVAGLAIVMVGLLPVFRNTGEPSLMLIFTGIAAILMGATILDLKSIVAAYKAFRDK